MFRENVLVNPEIIERVSETMIPVALDYQSVLDRRTAESRFIRTLMKQGGDLQGVYVYSPQGKRLGGSVDFGDMLGKTKRMIEGALDKFGPVEVRKIPKDEADPNRGHGFLPDGSVRLAEYVRRRDRDKIKSPVISSVTLSAKEFEAFAPAKAVAGEKWTLPDSVSKKLCRLASPMCFQHAPQPDWVKDIHLKARVRSIRNGLAVVRYEGRISSERIMRNGELLSKQRLTLEGEGVYDVASSKMRSLLLAGSGTFRWPVEAPDKVVPFEALVEWESRSLVPRGSGPFRNRHNRPTNRL